MRLPFLASTLVVGILGAGTTATQIPDVCVVEVPF